jgi:hypothetical protein
MTGPTVVTLSSVEPENVDWLWPGRLPLGKLVVLDGDPSVGKSTTAVDCAARVSTGRAWPDGAAGRPGDVLLLSAEDGLADTIRPRLDAAGGDPARVHALTEIKYSDEDGVLRSRPVTLGDVEAIEAAVRKVGAKLIVVDVLMAFMPSKADAHRDQDVRGVLSEIAGMAERTRTCVLLLRHLNKASGGSPLYRGGGSIGIIGAARVGLLAAQDPEDETRRVLAATKSNLAVMPPALGYRLVDSPEHGCARVEWLGATDHDAQSLLHSSAEEDRAEADELVSMLRMILDDAGGETLVADAMKRLRANGATPSKDTLFRARKRAGIASRKAAFGGGWLWHYSQGSAEDSEGSASQTPRTFRPLGEPSPPQLALVEPIRSPKATEPNTGCGHPASSINQHNGRCGLCIAAAHSTPKGAS